MNSWAEYFYNADISRREAEKREEMYQAFKDRFLTETLVDEEDESLPTT